TNEKLTNKEIYVLRIQPEHEPDGFLLIADENNTFKSHFLKQVSHELEIFFNIMNCDQYKQYIQEQNVLLLDFSSQLHSIYNTKDIFRLVIKVLKRVHPHFSHHLLLSQDYEKDSSLPIKTIDYGQEAFQTAGTRAFMSG